MLETNGKIATRDVNLLINLLGLLKNELLRLV